MEDDVDRGGEKGFSRIDRGFTTRPDSRAMAAYFLARDDPETAAKICLVGQPVALGSARRHPTAALRISAGARLVTETWSSDGQTALENLHRELGRVDAIVAKIEWLVAHMDSLNSTEPCHEA